jgi:hypothetical protein
MGHHGRVATERDRTPLLPLTPPSRTHQRTIVLNDYGGTVLSQRTRTNAAGRSGVRMTLDIKSTPLLVNLNGMELGRGPSEAIKGLLQQQTRAISQPAAPATILRRKAAASAVARGDSRAIKRYTAARTKAGPPGTYSTIGNDSGMLANGFFVTQNPKEGSWTINVTANRFDPATWGGSLASLQAWIARYVSLMPALRDPRTITASKEFRDAVMAAPPVRELTRSSMRVVKDWITAINQGLGRAEGVVTGGGLF